MPSECGRRGALLPQHAYVTLNLVEVDPLLCPMLKHPSPWPA